MITQVPAGIPSPIEEIKNGAVVNDDGHGVAIFTDNGVELMKSMKLEETLDFLQATRKKGEPFMFHSRYATAGTTNEFNIHPFYVGDGPNEILMAHNGVMPQRYDPKLGDPRSDTRIFVDRLGELMRDLNRVPSRREAKAIGSLIGTGNKLTFMALTEQGVRTRIINATAGVQHKGSWFSNSGFEFSSYWRGYRDSGRSWFQNDREPELGSTNQVSHYLAKVARRTENVLNVPCFDCKKYTVAKETHYCKSCHACNDCFENWTSCMCYSGKQGDPFRNQAEYDGEEFERYIRSNEYGESCEEWIHRDDKVADTETLTHPGSEITLNFSDGSKETVPFSPTSGEIDWETNAGWGE